MSRPRKDEPQHKTHWPSNDVNSLGQVIAICKTTGSYYLKPQFAKLAQDVTCGVCRRFAMRMR